MQQYSLKTITYKEVYFLIILTGSLIISALSSLPNKSSTELSTVFVDNGTTQYS